MLAITFGLLSSACLILASLSLRRKRILFLSLGINIFTGLQYMLLGQTGALVLVALGFVMTCTVLASFKFPALGTAKVLAGFLVAYPAVFFATGGWVESWPELLPLFSTMVATTALFMRNLLLVKAMFIVNGLSWMAFEIFAGAYGALPGEVLTLTGNITSFALLARAYFAGIALDTVPELNVRIASLVRLARGRRNPVVIVEPSLVERELVAA